MKIIIIVLQIFLAYGFAPWDREEKREVIHEVQIGEELMTISNKYYGTHQNWRKIIAANPNIDPNAIVPGQKLIIPIEDVQGPAAVVVKVMSEKMDNEDSRHERYNNEKEKIVASKKIEQERERLAKEKWRDAKEKAQGLEEKLSDANELIEDLKREILEIKEQNIALTKKLDKLDEVSDNNKDLTRKIASLEDEADTYKSELEKKRDKLVKLEKNNPLVVPNSLNLSEIEILREKNRILGQRLWVENNREFGECKIVLNKEEQKDEFSNLVLFLTEKYGTQNISIGQNDQTLSINIPGRMVYGVENPQINSSFYEDLFEISNRLTNLSIKRIEFLGQTNYKIVTADSGQSVSGEGFILSQALALQNYFENELGWSPSNLKSSALVFPQEGKEIKKFFTFKIELEQSGKNERTIESQVEFDDSLKTLGDELTRYLGEPKYFKLSYKDHSMHLNLAHHYFFQENSSQISPKGLQYIDRIMDSLIKTNMVEFQLSWAGEGNSYPDIANKNKALSQIASLKNHIYSKHPWAKDKFTFSYLNKHNRLDPNYGPEAERMNRRIVFSVVPQSINRRELGDVSD
jgi:hypothetical protein